MERTIGGNPDYFETKKLHRESWPIAERFFDASIRSVKRRCIELLDTGQAAARIETVVVAAHGKRVDKLIARKASQVWGRCDWRTGRPMVHETPEPEDEELVNAAAALTCRYGGEVYETEDVPRGWSVVAALRGHAEVRVGAQAPGLTAGRGLLEEALS